MDKKWLFLILAIIVVVCFVFFLSSVQGEQYLVQLTNITNIVQGTYVINGTEFYELSINISAQIVNASSISFGSNWTANYSMYNGTLFPLDNNTNNAIWNMTVAEDQRTTFEGCYNTTLQEPCWRNFTIVVNDTGRCPDNPTDGACGSGTGPMGNLTWLNTTPHFGGQSNATGWTVYRINERPINSTSITFAEDSFKNNTGFTKLPPLIVRLNRTLSSCKFDTAGFNVSNSAQLGLGTSYLYGWNTSMANYTNRTTYRNSTTMVDTPHAYGFNETFFNQSNNITVECFDAYGNTSGSMNMSSLRTTYFWIDRTTPQIYFTTNFSLTNTTSLQYANFTFNVTDNTTHIWKGGKQDGTLINSSCGIRAWRENSNHTYSIVNFSGTWQDDRVRHEDWCGNMNVYGENLTGDTPMFDGDITIQTWANDSAGNEKTLNETYMVSYLYAGWNLITYSDANKTPRAFLSQFPNASAVSFFNNLPSAKNYTTHTINTPTINNGSWGPGGGDGASGQIYMHAGNATWLYVNSTTNYLRQNYIDELAPAIANVTLYTATVNWNGTGTPTNRTSWNLITPFQDLSMNLTLYTCNADNAAGKAAGGGQGDCGTASLLNISMISFYNATSQNYVTCMRNMTYCSGIPNPEQQNVTTIMLKRTMPIWVLPNGPGNITINRTSYNISYTKGYLARP